MNADLGGVELVEPLVRDSPSFGEVPGQPAGGLGAQDRASIQAVISSNPALRANSA